MTPFEHHLRSSGVVERCNSYWNTAAILVGCCFSCLQCRDVTKLAFKFDNVQHRMFSADSKFVEFFHVLVVELEPKVYTIGTTSLRMRVA